MKQLSTARKFKLITGQDLIQTMKKLEADTNGDGSDVTDTIEFMQYGLHLAFYEDDLTKAKRSFTEFKETGQMDADTEAFQKLVERWSAEFKG